MDMLTTLHTSAHQLGAIPDGTVQAVITSPPYYGLRSYAGEQDIEWPSVTYRLNEWCEPVTVQGCEPGCAHEWVTYAQKRGSGGEREYGSYDSGVGRGPAVKHPGHNFCPHCGGWRGPLGLEPSPVAYIGHLILCLREWRRVLRDDGVCFVNLGDSYAGSGGAGGDYNGGGIREGQPRWKSQFKAGETVKPKDLLGIPWMFAFAARADGWWLRSGITWIKGNPMPESVTDRCTKATEMVFMLAKSQRYYYDSDAVRVLSNGLNRFDGINEAVLKIGTNGASPGSFTSQRRDVSLNDQWAPYLILSSLLTAKLVLVKERDNHLSQILDTLQDPSTRGVSWAVLSGLLKMNAPANVLGYIFEHIGIVLSQGNLQSETELRIRIRSITAAAMEGYDGSFPIKEAREVVSKIIANAQAIRDAFTLDVVSECFVNIDMIYKAVTLLECSHLDTGHGGDRLVTKAVLEEFLLASSKVSGKQRVTVEGHDKSPLVGAFSSDYTTKQPSGANLRDWWYVNTSPYAAAHYAVWPERLVEPMVKAATSERGCCPKCGAGWVRVVERNDIDQKANEVISHNGVPGLKPGTSHDRVRSLSGATYQRVYGATLGWRPSCACDAGEPVPCTVLDPFAGSGTTGRVAIRFGRRAILCDVSAEYLVDHVPDRTTVQMELLA